jgi:hypothetical protein
MDFGYTDVVHYLEFGHGVNQRVSGAPALLRRERRWVRSALFSGEFNGALVAPFNSTE